MLWKNSKNESGISLVEILVVLAVVGILIGILLPMIQIAREAMRRQTCTNQIHQLALAVQAYYDANDSYPLLGCYSAGADLVEGQKNVKYNYPRINSIVALFPFLNETELSQKIFAMRLDKGDTVARETKHIPEIGSKYQLTFLRCPSDTVPNMDGEQKPDKYTPIAGRSYVYCSGDFPDTGIKCYLTDNRITEDALANYDLNNKNTRTAIPAVRDFRKSNYITDGLANTILFGEKTRGSVRDFYSIKTAARMGNLFSEFDSPIGENPGPDCIDEKWRSESSERWDTSVRTIALMGGVRAYDGIPVYSTFSTITPPNSPSCMYDYDIRPLFSVSSYHAGGANVVRYDGSVLFVNDDINIVTEGVEYPTIKDSGRSDYGVWGSMGAVNETAQAPKDEIK